MKSIGEKIEEGAGFVVKTTNWEDISSQLTTIAKKIAILKKNTKQ